MTKNVFFLLKTTAYSERQKGRQSKRERKRQAASDEDRIPKNDTNNDGCNSHRFMTYVYDWKNSNARHFRQLARSFSTNLPKLYALNIEILRKDNTKTIERNAQHRGCMKCYYFWVPYNSCRFSLSVVMFMILLCLLYVFNSIFRFLSIFWSVCRHV